MLDDDDIFNNFIDDAEDYDEENSKSKNINSKKNDENEIISPLVKEEKEIKIKLLKLRNDVLTKKLSEKRKLLKEIKKMCSDQKKRIDELKKKITDNILKQNNGDSKINFDNKHQINNINNNNTPKALIDQIETINFDLYNTTLFQCGICMDSFNENEQIKKLHCDHIFHIDCMSQWLQTKKTCPFCDQAIFY